MLIKIKTNCWSDISDGAIPPRPEGRVSRSKAFDELEKLKIENEQLTQHITKLNKIATINMVVDAIILVCIGIAYLI